jgi:hypothetical protein
LCHREIGVEERASSEGKYNWQGEVATTPSGTASLLENPPCDVTLLTTTVVNFLQSEREK